MADKKISQATERTTLDGTEQLPIAYNSNPYKVLISTIKDYVITFFTNKTTLDKITESGAMYFDGKEIYYPFQDLTDGAEVEVDCEVSTNGIFETEEAAVELSIVNAYSGMFGVIIIGTTETSTSITFDTTTFGEYKKGNFTALPIGIYAICWVCTGANIFYNIGLYE
jgi:hypothetical protein